MSLSIIEFAALTQSSNTFIRKLISGDRVPSARKFISVVSLLDLNRSKCVQLYNHQVNCNKPNAKVKLEDFEHELAYYLEIKGAALDFKDFLVNNNFKFDDKFLTDTHKEQLLAVLHSIVG